MPTCHTHLCACAGGVVAAVERQVRVPVSLWTLARVRMRVSVRVRVHVRVRVRMNLCMHACTGCICSLNVLVHALGGRSAAGYRCIRRCSSPAEGSAARHGSAAGTTST